MLVLRIVELAPPFEFLGFPFLGNAGYVVSQRSVPQIYIVFPLSSNPDLFCGNHPYYPARSDVQKIKRNKLGVPRLVLGNLAQPDFFSFHHQFKNIIASMMLVQCCRCCTMLANDGTRSPRFCPPLTSLVLTCELYSSSSIYMRKISLISSTEAYNNGRKALMYTHQTEQSTMPGTIKDTLRNPYLLHQT